MLFITLPYDAELLLYLLSIEFIPHVAYFHGDYNKTGQKDGQHHAPAGLDELCEIPYVGDVEGHLAHHVGGLHDKGVVGLVGIPFGPEIVKRVPPPGDDAVSDELAVQRGMEGYDVTNLYLLCRHRLGDSQRARAEFRLHAA